MNKGENILIPFDMIIDTDLGILNTVKKYYLDNDLVDDYIFRYTENQIVNLLLNRKFSNPLCLVINNFNDELYDEMYDTHTEYILNNSKNTQLINMLMVSSDSSLFTINVLCKNKYEETFLRNKVSHINNHIKYIVGNIDDISIDHYSSIFIKNYKDLLNINDKINETTLCIAKTIYNTERDSDQLLGLPNELLLVFNREQIMLVDMYNIDESYILPNKEEK